MLTALRLGNFKAFGAAQRLPIKPITLVFGPNSAGKSSLIHGLALAHEALREGSLEVHRTQIGGSSIDLGGFRQYVFRRNAESTVEWGVELDLAQAHGRLADLLAYARTAAVTLSIGIPLDDRGEPRPRAVPRVLRFELEVDRRPFLRMGHRDEALRFDFLDTEHPVMRQLLRALLELGTTVTSPAESDEIALARAVDEVLPTLSVAAGALLPGRVKGVGEREGTAFEVTAMVPVSRASREADLAGAVRLFVPRVLDELLRELTASLRGEVDRLRYLGPLRSFPSRHLAFVQHDDPNWHAGGGQAWDVVRRHATVREAVNRWLGSASRMQTPYRLRVRDLIAEEQLRRPLLERLESLEPDSFEFRPRTRAADDGSVAEGSESYPALADPEAEVSRLQEVIRESAADRVTELVLVDERTGTVVTHRDVGIGVSQVLPVLVSANANWGRVIAIEQPEIHLHPALQAELGDVFIESALGERRNTFLLETHSEHLILRVLRRIRETTDGELPSGLQPLRPTDVQVVYCRPTREGAVLHELPITEDGEFARPWPDGFFAERSRELF